MRNVEFVSLAKKLGRSGWYSLSIIYKMQQIKKQVKPLQHKTRQILFCPVFGLWSYICIFRGEQTRQN